MSVNEILSGLVFAAAPSGAENPAAKLCAELLSDYSIKSRQDALGSVIAEIGKKDAKEHILFDAHIDEIGYIVTFVDDDGFLHIDRCGGSDRRVTTDLEVVVYGEKKLPGVICCMPPHLTDAANRGKAPEWSKTYIDIGYSGEEAKKLVPPGSRVVARPKLSRLLNGRCCSKSLDDRAGAAVLLRTIELLEAERDELPCRVSFLFSTMEEVGGQGARVAAFGIAPTQAIAVDVGFALQPGAPEAQCGKLGAGPMIACAPTMDFRITKCLRALCEENSIPWQHDIMNGSTGTNGDDISLARSGVRTGVVSVAQRNMHTPVEIIETEDIENTARLLAAFARNGGAPLEY